MGFESATAADPAGLLAGAYDLHVHCGPDVVRRADDLVPFARSACAAGLAGVVIKDHNTSTVGRVVALNDLLPGPTRFYAALALNHAVGGVNPVAVRAALRAGATFVFMPTNASRHQYRLGRRPDREAPTETDPADDVGLAVTDAAGRVTAEARRICELVAEFDAVLATGHISPEESLALLAAARETGVKRTIVTHASQPVPGMTVDDQKRCADLGAFIEHSFLACTAIGGDVPLPEMLRQARQVGYDRCILSSDLGQVPNGPVVAGFGTFLARCLEAGLGRDDVRRMTVDNPRRLLGAQN